MRETNALLNDSLQNSKTEFTFSLSERELCPAAGVTGMRWPEVGVLGLHCPTSCQTLQPG